MNEGLLRALSHVRAAMIANKAGMPVSPPLQAAEEQLLRLLFPAQKVDDYLSSRAAQIFLPDTP